MEGLKLEAQVSPMYGRILLSGKFYESPHQHPSYLIRSAGMTPPSQLPPPKGYFLPVLE